MGLLTSQPRAGLLSKGIDWNAINVQSKSPFSVNPVLDNRMTAETVVKGTPGLLKNIAQGTARGFAAAGAALAGLPRQVVNTFTGGDTSIGELDFSGEPEDSPLGQLQRAIFGTNDPISLQSEGEDLPFVEKGSAAAPFLSVGLTALDLFGAGGAAKNTLRGLVTGLQATEDVAEATTLLRRAGFAEDIAQDYAQVFAKTTDEATIASGLQKAQDLQNSTRERGFITSTRETVPELSGRVAGQYIPRDTGTLASKARNLVNDDIDTAERLARTGTSDSAVATAAELIRKYTDDARASTDAAVQNTLYDKAAEIANTVARTLTEQGRAVQAASILGRLTPEGVVRFAAREIQRYNEGIDSAKATKGGMKLGATKAKIPELSGKQIADLTTKAKAIEAMPDGVEKAIAWHKLSDEIASYAPSTLYQKIIAVWKAGLLTGMKTTGLNVASNLFHGISEVAKDIPAAAVDSVAALFTGKRTTTITGRGTGKGLVEGFQKGWRYLKTGFDERDVGAKLDYRKVNFGNSVAARAMQTYEETIFRFIGSQDQPFYYGAKARSLYSQAGAIAKNEGLSGAERAARIDELIQAPTDDMLKYAVFDAETAVFQNKTALASAAKSLQNIPGGEFVIPFSKTPSAVAMQVLNYSPLGVVKTLAENIGKGRFDQRLFSQSVGRNLTGTGIMYLGYTLFENNLVSLGYPSSEKEREEWRLEGRSPNSILIDGEWRSTNALGPAGLTLILGGYLAQGVEQTGSITSGLITMATGLPKTLTDQTFLRGLDQFMDAITDPIREGQGYFAGLIGSIVPTIVSDVARTTDDVERRSEGLFDRFMSRVPGLRQALQPQIDVFGQENAIDTNILETMADPTRPSEASTDPVVMELRRLSDAGFQSTPTLLGDRGGYDVLTPEENTMLWRRSGEILKSKLDNLIQSEAYKEKDDEQKQQIIESFTSKAKTIARAEMVAQLTLDMTGPRLKEELSRIKAGGLLTRDVYEKYAEIR